MKSRLYYRWHLNSLSSPIHWAVLSLFIVAVATFGFFSFYPGHFANPPGTKAATTWTVTGAGDPTYDGTYTESGTYNGKPAYTLDASHWMWWGMYIDPVNRWHLAASAGWSGMYGGTGGADLPANPWRQEDGATPVPTVVVGYSVSGTVTNGGDSGLQGATVNLTGDSSASTTTDMWGNFSFSGLANGNYYLAVTMSGKTFHPAPVDVTVAGNNITSIHLWSVINYYSDGGSQSNATGTFVETAPLVNGMAAYQNEHGWWLWTNGWSNWWYIGATVGATTFQKTYTISGSYDTGGPTLSTNPASHHISGTVTEGGDSGINGATVNLTGDATATTTTDMGGNFSFPGLADGNYYVTVTMSGKTFHPTIADVTIAGNSVTGVHIWSIINYYSDGGSQPNATGTFVETAPLVNGMAAYQNEHGWWLWTNGWQNWWYIGASIGAPSFQKSYTISGPYDTGGPTLSTNPASHHISGNVTEGGDSGTSGATVDLTGDATATTTTDMWGNFSFPALADGTYHVTVTKSGKTFRPATADITIAGNSVTGVHVWSVINYYSDGGPEPNATGTFVETGGLYGNMAAYQNEHGWWLWTNGWGNWWYISAVKGTPNIFQKTYTISGNYGDYNSPPTVGTDPNCHHISGTVTEGGDSGTSGATVDLTGDATASTTTDMWGNFSFPALADGTYHVTATMTGKIFHPTTIDETVAGNSISGIHIWSVINYYSEGGSEPNATGTFVETGALYNGMAAYQNQHGWWLWTNGWSNWWYISAVKGTPNIFQKTYTISGNYGDYNSPPTVTALPSVPPDAATGASIGSIDSTLFTVNWTDNSDNESGFKVYISTTANADCSLATYPGSPDYTAAENAVSQNVIDKDINTRYCAKVVATNVFGDADPAYSAPKYTLSNQPDAPTLSAPSGGTIQITVNPNNNPSNTRYAIYNSTLGQYVKFADGTNQALEDWQASTSATNINLSPNVQYSFTVKADNGDGVQTASSISAQKYSLANPPMTAAVVSRTTTGINWSWNANSNPGTTNFYASDSAGNSGWSTSTTWNQDSLSANTKYTLSAKARNGDTTETAPATLDAYTAIEAPTGLASSGITQTSITISEQGSLSNLGTDQSAIRYCNTTTSACSAWQTAIASYTFDSLSSATEYAFTVESRNGDGVSGGVASASATTLSPPPPPTPVPGCTDSSATNYNSSATVDNGSCTYSPPSVPGCTNSSATNYNSQATVDDGSCIYSPPPVSVSGCTDSSATNYNSSATVEDGSCTFPPAITGCTDPNASNYNSAATQDDDSCTYYQSDLPPEYRYLFLSISPNLPSLQRGETAKYSAKVFYGQDDLTSQCTVGWSVINSGAGTIDSASGQFTASQNAGLWSDVVKAVADCPVGSTYGLAGVSIITEPRQLNYVYLSPYAPPRSVMKGIDPDLASYSIYSQDQYFVSLNGVKGITFGASLLDNRIGTTTPSKTQIPILTSNNYGCYPDKIKGSATYLGVTKEGYDSISIFPPNFKPMSAERKPSYVGSNPRFHFRPGESYTFAKSMRDQYGQVMTGTNFVWIVNEPKIGTLTPDGKFIASGNAGTYKKAITLKGIWNGIEKTATYNINISLETRIATQVKFYNYPTANLSTTKTIKLTPGSTQELSAYLYDQFGDVVIYESGDRLSLNDTSAPLSADNRNITSTGNQSGFYKDAIKLSFAWPDWADPDKHVDGPSPEVLLSVDVNPANAVDPKACIKNNTIDPNLTHGCMNPAASNYDDQATVDDGSCVIGDVVIPPNPPGTIDIPWLPPFINDILNAIFNSPIGRAATAVAAALAAGLAMLMAPLSNFASLYSLPEFAHIFSYSYLSAGILRRKRKKWGRVVEDGTGIPLASVMVSLIKVDESGGGKIIENTYTDKSGAYGFATQPGSYKVIAKKDKYNIAPETNQYYDFNPAKVYKVEKYDEGLIIPTIVLSMSDRKITGVYKTLIFFKKLERIMNYVSIVILVIGTIAIIRVIMTDRSTLNIIILAGYILLWILNVTLLLRHSPWSMVQDKSSKKPISLSIVRITDKNTNKLVKTTVSDEKGKFSAILKKGKYNIYAAKEGYSLDHPLEIDTSEEMTALHKKVELEKNSDNKVL